MFGDDIGSADSGALVIDLYRATDGADGLGGILLFEVNGSRYQLAASPTVPNASGVSEWQFTSAVNPFGRTAGARVPLRILRAYPANVVHTTNAPVAGGYIRRNSANDASIWQAFPTIPAAPASFALAANPTGRIPAAHVPRGERAGEGCAGRDQRGAHCGRRRALSRIGGVAVPLRAGQADGTLIVPPRWRIGADDGTLTALDALRVGKPDGTLERLWHAPEAPPITSFTVSPTALASGDWTSGEREYARVGCSPHDSRRGGERVQLRRGPDCPAGGRWDVATYRVGWSAARGGGASAA